MESAPVAGSRAGRYLFLRQLTSSFVGALWEARCEAETQLLALARVVKLPSDVDPEVEQALAEAAWDSLELDDDSVVRVADAVFGTGWFALVHDHHEGDTLRTMQRRVQERKSAIPVPVALRIVLDTALAIKGIGQAVAQLGVPWQAATIDPGSLLVCDDGRTRVLDGFVGHLVPNVRHMARESDSLAYAAPEQFNDASLNEERSQVFRLGVIAWELLTSKRLLVGSKPVMKRRLESPIIRVDRVVRVGNKACEKLAKVVEKALRVDPMQRFASIADFHAALSDAAESVAHQEEVVQFADALVGRESTLARLVMDKPQRLSDAIKSVRPTADVAKSFAAHVRSGSKSKARGDAKQAQRAPADVAKPNVGRAPDALFGALPRVPKVPTKVPPGPGRHVAPAPIPRVAASPTQAAAAHARAAAAPRGRMKTLIGLADELSQPLASQQAAIIAPPAAIVAPIPAAPALLAPADEAPPARDVASLAETPDVAGAASPVSSLNAVPPATSEATSLVGQQAAAHDDADDFDEQEADAYAAAGFEDAVSELKPRKELESGPRLASKPPPGSAATAAGAGHAGFENIDDEVTRIAAGGDDLMGFDDEVTRVAASTAEAIAAAEAQSRPQLAGAVPQPVAAAAPVNAVALATAPANATDAATPAKPKAASKEVRRLLVLALFFAGTTLMLGVLAAGLFVRAQAAEQAADALAAAPLQASKATGKAAAAPGKEAAPAAPRPPTATPSQMASPVEQAHAVEPNDEGEDATDDTANAAATAKDDAAATAAALEPAAKPVVKRKRRVPRRATGPKTEAKTRYVPSDI